MPELPEVETTRRGIEPYLKGLQITQVVIRHYGLRWPVPADLAQILTEQTVHHVQRRAKYLLLECDNGTLMIHLGMSGRLRVLDNADNINKHDHIDITFANGHVLRYTDPRRFGAFLWTQSNTASHPLIEHLGPEPLSDGFNADYLYNKAKGRKSPIKTFIMNGEIVVGVGNIYANEALFMAGIHPAKSVGNVSKKQLEKLVVAIKQVLEKALLAGGTTLRDFRKSDGKPGYFAQELNVYGRADEACPVCGQLIQSIRQAQRATYFCPGCQPK